MTKIYTNEIGKSRPADEDSLEYSSLRKEWFLNFETQLKQNFPDIMEEAQLRIVGSV